MVTEENKYKAETCKIIGITMLAPIGAVFLTPLLLYKQLGSIGLMVYICVSIASLLIGGMLLEVGRKFMKEKGIRKWNQMN